MYFTQRDNTIDPHGTCNVTAYAMAALAAGCMWKHTDGQQPEDVLSKFLLTKEAVAHMRKAAPWAFNRHGRMAYKPYEVHAMLVWAYNILADGIGKAEFATDWSLSELVYLQAQGAGVVLSGRFPHYKLKRIGHIVCLRGVEYQGSMPDDPARVDLAKVAALIVHDPYGDYRLGYDPSLPEYKDGQAVRMPVDDYEEIFLKKGAGRGCWAHVIMRTDVG